MTARFQPRRVLIVDDQPAVIQALDVLFDLNDIPHVSATSPRKALKIAAGEVLGAVIQDMNFTHREISGEEGIDLFHTLRRAQPDLPILLMTAWASLETAVELVREGAVDYIQKPWDDDKLLEIVSTILEARESELATHQKNEELEASRQALAKRHDLRDLVYASDAMHRLLTLAISVAESDAPVLVTGPSGSGKERIAEIIQANSRRAEGPFIRVNVGAMPEELLESELFGAEPGAYTGARGRRIGHFESAHRGTLFLDEVDSLSLAGQVKLLRVLQSGEFQRLGSSKTQRVDVRVISATNASLEEALSAGSFREDLFYRLNVVELSVPPLAERGDDVLPLARHFLDRFAGKDGRQLKFSSDAESAVLSHPWTGNVRELENRIQRATLVAGSGEISRQDLGLGEKDTGRATDSLTTNQQTERLRIIKILEEEDGIVAHAAQRLGISRQAFYRKMTRLGIEIERRPRI